jgi:hypothetical protein
MTIMKMGPYPLKREVLKKRGMRRLVVVAPSARMKTPRNRYRSCNFARPVALFSFRKRMKRPYPKLA